ncbi:carboxypeptidase regulatory-like domain-containing protein [Glycomyces sp. A-F 0318]|uniref:carboxypeptidase regulatory-like domain-containing protein n=1 Tax=Glycomyces amatae TaxID=2881355 RepID=UPI001E300F61|nr:carboxypeptidase regulatory-like domain-containing protein [Glycomyces amatae]MCD0442120.1 carboxypeptidase regulatory-like domain-containing protein [Glycomyces amatae]
MTVAAEPSGTQSNVPRARRRLGGGLLARLSGLAVALGVVIGILAFPQAALAQNQFAGTLSSGDQWIDIGGAPVQISVTIMAPPSGGSTSVEGDLDGIDDYAYVSIVDAGGCTAEGDSKVRCDNIEPSGSRTATFAINPMPESDLPQGEQKQGKFKAKWQGGEQAINVTVVGNAANSTGVISGKVTSNAEPVAGAKVVLTDGEGNDHETETGSDGGFEFSGQGIVPGDMVITVTKDDYEETSQNINVAAGSSFQANLTLAQVETEETTEAATTEAATSAAEESSPPPEEEGGGISGTLVFLIVIGALLVVGGIVGIFFLLRGGKDEDKDDGESFAPDGPPDHKPTAAQVGTPGVYQAGPAPGSEAPTMIHPGGLVDGPGNPSAPTQFGPAYGGGADSTQVMPQGGFGAPPPPPAPPAPGLGPDGTTILPVVKQPGGPGASDATQIMPQANLSQPPAAAPPSAFADPGATRPHPGPSAPPTPYSDPNATRPHPGPSAPSNPYSDPGATRPHPAPSAPSAPPTPYSDPNATRPHPGASPYGDPGATRPHPSPTPPPATGSMFEPQNPANSPSAPPPDQRFGSPSAPQYGPGSQGFGSQPGQPSQPGQGFGSQPSQPSQPGQGYGSHSAPSAPPSADPYPSQSMRRDPYAPQEQPAPPTGEYGATRAMPQQYGDQSQPPAPYGGESARDGREDEDPDSRRTDRRSWGEWDDRPRSW